jgi:hypothetical protein
LFVPTDGFVAVTVPVTVTALWSEAMTTGREFAEVF